MFISQLSLGDELKIKVAIQGQVLEFNTVVTTDKDKRLTKDTRSRGHVILIEPVRIKGNVVKFPKGKGCSYEVIYCNKEVSREFIWRDISIEMCCLSANNCVQVIFCNEDVKEVNRRSAYRQFVGCSGNIRVGENRRTYDVTVRDVSVTGVGFVAKEQIKDWKGVNSNIKFDDANTIFKLSCYIVREQLLEDGRYFYGCRLEHQVNAIERYIVGKQSEELKKRRLRV